MEEDTSGTVVSNLALDWFEGICAKDEKRLLGELAAKDTLPMAVTAFLFRWGIIEEVREYAEESTRDYAEHQAVYVCAPEWENVIAEHWDSKNLGSVGYYRNRRTGKCVAVVNTAVLKTSEEKLREVYAISFRLRFGRKVHKLFPKRGGLYVLLAMAEKYGQRMVSVGKPYIEGRDIDPSSPFARTGTDSRKIIA